MRFGLSYEGSLPGLAARMVQSRAGMAERELLEISNFVLQIQEAVKSVHQNEDECRKLASCVAINGEILKDLVDGTHETKLEEMCRALVDVKTTFEDALKFVKRCNSRAKDAADMANDFNQVQRDIGLRMQQASLCGAVHNARKFCIFPNVAAPRTLGKKYHIGITRFILSELKQATNNFSDEMKIGHGEFHSVYKGCLDNRGEVAIKKFHPTPVLGDISFRDELFVSSKLQHRNLVPFLGYCIDTRVNFREHKGRYVQTEDRTNYLVHRHMPNGNLEDIIAGTQSIGWTTCFKIIQETAAALCYLHEKWVIHADLKPANILLDRDMSPMISDFGLSKVLEHDDDEPVLLHKVVGSKGYMAPEKYSGRMSLMSDVYGFGLTVLRLITAPTMTQYSPTRLVPQEHWNQKLEDEGVMELALENTLCGYFDNSPLPQIKRCVEIGLLCIQSDPADRPTMADVVDMLSGKKKLPTPKKRERTVTNKVERAFAKKLGLALVP